MALVVDGDGAIVLDFEDSSSKEPPISQKDTVRFLFGEEGVLVSWSSAMGSTAVEGSESWLPRLLSAARGKSCIALISSFSSCSAPAAVA